MIPLLHHHVLLARPSGAAGSAAPQVSLLLYFTATTVGATFFMSWCMSAVGHQRDLLTDVGLNGTNKGTNKGQQQELQGRNDDIGSNLHVLLGARCDEG